MKIKFLSFVFVFFVILASSYIDYEYYNFLKFCVLGLSIAVIVNFRSYQLFTFDVKIFAYFLYVIFLVFQVRELDEFSNRIIFNSAVILFSAYAMLSLKFYKYQLERLLFLVMFFLIYAYFFRINHYDFKPQVHSQIFTLIVMMTILYFGNGKYRYAFITLGLVFLSNVRSVLIGFIPLFIVFSKKLSSKFIGIYFMSVIVLSCVSFYLLFDNLETVLTLFGESANSFSWRVYHWNNIFKDFEYNDWVFGKGLGFSWRTTLFIEDFYTDGSAYVAAHSNYVKIIADTGILGLLLFFSMLGFLYKKSSNMVKFLIVFYIGYGFYDEGVWFFSLIWLVILTYDRVSERDFNIANNKR